MSRYAYVPAFTALATGLFFAVGFGAALADYLGPGCAQGGAAFPCDAARTAMLLLGGLFAACLLVALLTLPRRR